MSQGDNHSIRINLDLSISLGGQDQSVRVTSDGQRTFTKAITNITHPSVNGDPTPVQPINARNYMCTYGTCGGDTRYVFAKVYDGVTPGADEPPDDTDTLWMRPDLGTWKFLQLYVPGATGNANTKTLVIWGDSGTAYDKKTRTFIAEASTYTYCNQPSNMMAVMPMKQVAKDWSIMPDGWQFQMSGVTDASACNCTSLNGTWLLRREETLLWLRKVDASFSDAKRSSWWRLSFNQKDGFWYLECVSDPAQPAGTSIAYRRHESAWNPFGSNELLLMSNQGYCNVPECVTVYPA